MILVLVLPTIGALAQLLGRPERWPAALARWTTSASRPPIARGAGPRYAEIAGLSHRRSEELDRRLDEAELTAREDEPGRRDDELGEPGTEAAGD